MNYLILSAGLLCALTAMIHIFAGQIDPVRPFLKSDLADIPKATLLACWHLVSAILVISAGALIYASWSSSPALSLVVLGVSAIYVVFAAVFIAVGWYFFGHLTLIKLPQWTLLLLIGALGGMGAI